MGYKQHGEILSLKAELEAARDTISVLQTRLWQLEKPSQDSQVKEMQNSLTDPGEQLKKWQGFVYGLFALHPALEDAYHTKNDPYLAFRKPEPNFAKVADIVKAKRDVETLTKADLAGIDRYLEAALSYKEDIDKESD